ncbi:hypothetical protein [Paenarthrobacter aromaticivorans]|uniref:Uncharacterized protein n=1 Tax=Paenarthrobacter aromaticivorans TaxID=2849150 RepID=A0ABS6IA05_9MICC|nr:hypothetical protein [Paenarthrobacter sp. MMS21-TAE1-1]MBU8868561.1 hypothetical protein [Paenarthrobacter sp. MMS21-TAE1-1]
MAAVALILSLVTGVQNWSTSANAADGSARQLDEQRRANEINREMLDRINQPALSGPNPGPTDQAATPKAKGCLSDGTSVPAGWGPARPIFADTATPQYALFNSIRDNPNLGDERSFYAIKDAKDTNGPWKKQVRVEKGHTYLVRVYIRNDAADVGAIATGTSVMVNLPTCTGTSIATNAWIKSNDAFPNEVWDGLTMNSDIPFNVAYMEGSAAIYNNSPNSPFRLTSTDFLEVEGQKIGFDSMDGVVRPGYSNVAYLVFEIKPQFAS